METGLTKKQVITQLLKSTHKDLTVYTGLTKAACAQDPEFLSHLIAWNHRKGHVRDSKVALPAIALTQVTQPEFVENALAALAALDPRNLVRAVRFNKSLKGSNKRALIRLVEQYLRAREAKQPWWDRTVLQHRQSIKELYALNHIKPNKRADAILFKDEKPGVFGVVASLNTLSNAEAATAILQHRIPFLVASTTLGKRMQDPALVFAIIEQMSPAELVTNMKALERLGVRQTAALRGAVDAKLQQVANSDRVVLKTSVAANQFKNDEAIAKQLHAVQEKQLAKLTIDGDWLILADKSGSMSEAIEVAQEITAILARSVTGKVHLVFFDASPRYFDMTGKTLEEIKSITQYIYAGGATSIGCGLDYALKNDLNFDGIAIISDGGENTAPRFHACYQHAVKQRDAQPPVYLYRVKGEPNEFAAYMQEAGLDYELFDLTKSKLDYYSLPNLVMTMRVNQYSLVDEIMNTPLMRVSEVLK